MKVALVTTQPGRELWVLESAEKYKKQIGAYLDFEIVYVKPKSAGREDLAAKRAADSAALLSKIADRDYVIICDEHGKDFDSIKFSKELVRALESGKPRVVFVVGGPYGCSEELKKRANLMLKLSTMTLSHWIAQTMLLEQIYRAISIWKNLPYHNE